jgi:protein arginine N-methyltransferase 1
VDIGTGTGVLAVAAARAGAKHVYAIEASDIGRAAVELFVANGVSDRVTLLPGWSSQVELPERADVLLAEIIGNDPVEEGVMETFADARKRLLVSDPRIIPARVQTFAIPVTLDAKVFARNAFSPDAAKNWKDWYDIDFDSLLTSPINKSIVFRAMPYTARDWPQLSSPVLLADLDLSGAKHPLVNESAEFTIETAGLLGGLLVYFELDVAPGLRISTSPSSAAETSSWAAKVWASGSQLPVKPGDKFKVNYKYRVDSGGTKIELIPENGSSI